MPHSWFSVGLELDPREVHATLRPVAWPDIVRRIQGMHVRAAAAVAAAAKHNSRRKQQSKSTATATAATAAATAATAEAMSQPNAAIVYASLLSIFSVHAQCKLVIAD